MSGGRRSDRALFRIAELGGREPGSLSPETPLADLGFDSLAFAELALTLEDELGLDVGETMLDGSGTVADVLEAVSRARPVRGATGVPASVGRLQRPANLLAGGALRWWLAVEVRGAEHVPRRGAAVLAMNHESALDIPIAVVACPRRITFMAKRELFEGRSSAWGLERLGGFRVDRGRFDLRAVQLGIAVLRGGGVLGMYPEGTRSPGVLLPFLHGAAWLALQTGAPIVPVSISGTERPGRARVPRRLRPRVSFAPPIRVPAVREAVERRRLAETLTMEVRDAVETGLRAASAI